MRVPRSARATLKGPRIALQHARICVRRAPSPPRPRNSAPRSAARRPGRPKGSGISYGRAVQSATLEAASSSSRGSGWAPSGPASPLWECRAARSRQARPEEAQEPSSGAVKRGA
eukprot:scaffold881_cov65-Phaeocystis_antarctica.AAC.3